MKQIFILLSLILMIIVSGCFEKSASDTEKPIITINGSQVISITVGSIYVDDGAKAFDNVDGDISGKITVEGLPVDTSIAKDFAVRYNVSDMAGNKADEVYRIIHVINEVDTEKPVITLKGTTVVSILVGNVFIDEGAVAYDNVDKDISNKIYVFGLVDTNKIGKYYIKYNVSDGVGNTADEVIRTVDVIPVPVSSIVLGTTKQAIGLGENMTISAIIKPINATDKTIKWTSSDSSIAEVNENGVVKAMKEGKVEISATALNGITAKVVIDVITIHIEKIVIDSGDFETYVGNILNMTATITPVNATHKEIIWSIDDSTVASIDGKGELTAKKNGETYIKVSGENGKSSSIKLTVSNITPTSISINKDFDVASVGNIIQYSLVTVPQNASKIAVWKSSDESIATISNTGKLTVLKEGTVEISAEAGNCLDKITLVCITTPVNNNIVIENPGEFIDISQNSVKLLFRATIGSNIKIYMGEKDNTITKVKEIMSYDGLGTVIDNLVPGKNYDMVILSSKDSDNGISKLVSFVKKDRSKTFQRAEWARNAVFYEVFVRSFYDGNGDGIGDFKGLTAKVDYFKELGVDALWLMPCFNSPSYHGYDVTDYYTIEKDYGTNEDFEIFLKAAHAKGIKVIVDLVANHSSWDNKMFLNSRESKDSEYRDYYVWKTIYDSVTEKGPWNQNVWLWSNSGYFFSIFGGSMPDLNLRNPKVREEIKNIAKFWIDKGVDGFRLDAAMHVDNKDMEVTHNWWQEFSEYTKSINPNTFIVGENWSDPATISKFFIDMDSSFDFTFADSVAKFASGQGNSVVDELKAVREIYASSKVDYISSIFIRNHDQDRILSELGNNKERAKIAATVLLTMPGTPFLYYGEELGQKGIRTQALESKWIYDEVRREPMDWYKNLIGDGMTSWFGPYYNTSYDGISYEEEKGVTGSIFEHYKKLLQIRKNNSVINKGIYEVIYNKNGIYIYKISDMTTTEAIFVICNPSDTAGTIVIDKAAVDLLTDNNYLKSDTVKINSLGSIILKADKSMKIM